MSLPTWDLFAIVFGVIIIAYTFIVGIPQTVKIIFSSYISFIFAGGIGDVISKYITGPEAIIKVFDFENVDYFLIVLKIIIFILGVIYFSLHTSIDVIIQETDSKTLYVIQVILIGGLLSSIFAVSMLLYIMGFSLTGVENELALLFKETIYKQSFIVQRIIENASLIFALPVLFFMIIFSRKN